MKLVSLLLFCCIVATGVLFANEKKELILEGTGEGSAGAIEKILEVKQYPLIYFWTWFDMPEIQDRYISTIGPRLYKYYESIGFYNPHFHIKETNSSVTVKIDEGQKVIVRTVTVKSDANISALIPFQSGERFNPATFTESKKKISEQMLNDGYCNFTLDAKAYVDITDNSADVMYDLSHNKKRCVIASIDISGLTNIDSQTVIDHLDFSVGDTFSLRTIRRSYTTLENYGAFSIVQINYKDINATKVHIKIKLEESSTPRSVKFGVGYSTNEGFRATANWTHFNFLGGLRRLEFDAKISQIEQRFSNHFTQPNLISFGSDAWIRSIDYYHNLYYRYKTYTDYYDKTTAFIPELQKSEYVRDLGTGVRIQQTNVLARSTSAQSGQGNYFIVAPLLRVGYDMRNSKIRTTSGGYIKNYVEYGVPQFGSEVQYLKLVEEIGYAKTLGSFLLGTRLRAGIIDEYKNHLPYSLRFYGGGAFSNRAYEYELVPASNASATDGPLNGGKTLIDGSLNVIHPIVGDLDGLVFLDATVLNRKELNFSGPVMLGVGPGLSYNTPAGPIIVSIGFDPLLWFQQYAVQFQIGYSF